MTLFNQIKTDQLAARKSRDKLTTSLLTTLIGDLEMVAKTAGTLCSDDQVITTIKKFIKNIDLALATQGDVSTDDGSADYYVNQLMEKSKLEQYLPQQLTTDEISVAVDQFVLTVGKDKGLIMKALKEAYHGQYDAKLASIIVGAAVK